MLPKGALAARVGGDDFAVILRCGSLEELDELAGLLRGAVRGSRSTMPLEGIDVDASVGYAIAPRDGETLEELITAADDAMYREKATHDEEATSGRVSGRPGGSQPRRGAGAHRLAGQ